MNARLLKFLLASLCMHLAVSWLLLRPGSFEHGVAQGGWDRVPALTVSLLAADNRQVTAESVGRSTEQTYSDDSPPAPKPSPALMPMNSLEVLKSHTAQDYVSVSTGRLTRLPSPLGDIDLDVAEISGLGYAGQARLTILINADGSVVDVLGESDAGDAHEFVKRVAARFRSTRFMPGEIDGVAVNSQMQITVVSETPTAVVEQ